VANLAAFDPKAKPHSAQRREEMKRALEAIAKDPSCIPGAEREGGAPQVLNKHSAQIFLTLAFFRMTHAFDSLRTP